MPIEERFFSALEMGAQALANDLAAELRDAVSVRKKALIAVSGGYTPKLVFEYLRQLNVNWGRVTITLTDERWVSTDHPDSNEGLVRTSLLQGPAAGATFIPLFGGEDSPEAGRPACEARLKTLPLPFDAVFLGMGDDGHFASFFPGDPAVKTRIGRCVPIPGMESRRPRMTLTVPTILSARKIFLLFSGAGKRSVYNKAMNVESSEDIPVRRILRQTQTPLFVLIGP
jgi:6-phosphogluconolactonase